MQTECRFFHRGHASLAKLLATIQIPVRSAEAPQRATNHSGDDSDAFMEENLEAYISWLPEVAFGDLKCHGQALGSKRVVSFFKRYLQFVFLAKGAMCAMPELSSQFTATRIPILQIPHRIIGLGSGIVVMVYAVSNRQFNEQPNLLNFLQQRRGITLICFECPLRTPATYFLTDFSSVQVRKGSFSGRPCVYKFYDLDKDVEELEDLYSELQAFALLEGVWVGLLPSIIESDDAFSYYHLMHNVDG